MQLPGSNGWAASRLELSARLFLLFGSILYFLFFHNEGGPEMPCSKASHRGKTWSAQHWRSSGRKPQPARFPLAHLLRVGRRLGQQRSLWRLNGWTRRLEWIKKADWIKTRLL